MRSGWLILQDKTIYHFTEGGYLVTFDETFSRVNCRTLFSSTIRSYTVYFPNSKFDLAFEVYPYFSSTSSSFLLLLLLLLHLLLRLLLLLLHHLLLLLFLLLLLLFFFYFFLLLLFFSFFFFFIFFTFSQPLQLLCYVYDNTVDLSSSSNKRELLT